jgi:hypothetical protein
MRRTPSQLIELKVVDFFPEEAIYRLTAMSERALAYGVEPLRRRMILLAEAGGASGEFASLLIRSLLSEGRLIYETVDKKDGELAARRIEREGPTGLMVTTTRHSLHPENETRLLSVDVEDSAVHTAAILREQARQDRRVVDLEPWHALQIWLARSTPRIVVPFAAQIADAVPASAVRLRRDFPTVLSLIRAHALLHQASRARSEDGAVVAQLADYAAVRALIADLVAAGVERTVKANVRETVEVVKRLNGERAARGETDGVANKDVAKALNLDASAATRRLKDAEGRGYLKNLTESRGRPSQWVLDADMPEDEDVLPSVERVAGLFESTALRASDCTIAHADGS